MGREFYSFKYIKDCFWLLTMLIENIIPLDYYTNLMTGVICDL